MTLLYSRGRGINDSHPQQRSAADFAAFVAALDHDRAATKAKAAYFCGPLNGDGRRCAEGAQPRRWLALDLDKVNAARLPDLRMYLARFRGAGWTTHSNTPEQPRERAVLELDRDATRDECIALGRAIMHDLAEHFGGDVALDDCTFRGEQPVFVPPVGVQLAHFMGEPLAVDKWLQDTPADAPEPPARAERDDGKVKAGGRNAALSREAYRLRRQGLSVEQIADILQAMNAATCSPLLPADEVAKIAARKARVEPEQPAEQPADPAGMLRRIVRGDEFLRTFRVPDPLIEGLIPRRQLYAMTGATGHGKTAVATTMQVHIANGLAFAGREVERGAVLVLAGENPDDYALRLLATIQALGLKPEALHDVLVLPGSFALGPALADIGDQVGALGPLAAVFVDTSAAFFDGEDENANVAMRVHASRLRSLCDLPGGPAVIVLCHPVKHATRENLLPRGGGAFLAEIDGNLTTWRDDKLVTMHWAGKLRGPGFEPLTFELAPERLAVTDTKGREVHSVAALPATGDRAEALEQTAMSDENRLLVAMQRKPNGSVADLAMAAGFTGGAGTPQKSRTHRVLAQLAAQGLARKTRAGRWQLTGKGRNEADEVPNP